MRINWGYNGRGAYKGVTASQFPVAYERRVVSPYARYAYTAAVPHHLQYQVSHSARGKVGRWRRERAIHGIVVIDVL